MKNNAIQHISTICRDEEIMKRVGVLRGGGKDVYSLVAEKVYEIYKACSSSV